MTPPPMTIKSFGTLGRDKAPVEEMITFSSYSSPGNGLASLPVAMMMFFAVICYCFPSASTTSIVCWSTKAPWPFMYVTLFFLNNPSIPFVNDVTMPFLVYWTLPQLSDALLTSIPIFEKSWLSSWYLCEMFNNAFDGIQPTLRHVPPRAPLF